MQTSAVPLTQSSVQATRQSFVPDLAPAQQLVYRLALRITRNPVDAEDAQQETFLKAYRKLGQFEGRSRLTTWISRIAINEALMSIRRKRAGSQVPLEEAAPGGELATAWPEFRSPLEDPEQAYLRRELRDALLQAVTLLRPPHRVVFLLRVVEQLSTTETARILRISSSAVKARLRRARGELQATLQAHLSVSPSQQVAVL